MNDREPHTPAPSGAPDGPSHPGETSAAPTHAAPPGSRAMNVVRWVLFGGLLLLAIASVGGYLSWSRAQRAATTAATARFFCPMHPSYTSARPGECPICGMTLEPIPAGGLASTTGTGAGDVPGLTSVHLSPERIQLIGVRTAVVTKRALGGELELSGLVAPDEGRLARVQLRVSGWVQELMVNRTGQPVRAGEPLLSLYSPELYQSEQEFLIEAGARDTSSLLGGDSPAATSSPHTIGTARQRLRLLGIPDEEIRRLERERTPSTRLTLRAPVTGTVLERGVAQGQYVGPDTPLFTISDLARLWVLADFYEMDYSRVRVGDPVRFTADALPARVYAGRVDFVYPTVSSETRTLKARISLANPRGDLLPGMYGRVRIARRGGAALAVPSEAVVRTGGQEYVFLAHADGHFEPRRVTVSATGGEWAQVVGGVAEGDTVVASASFLIDSESRLKAAISGMSGQSRGSAP